MPGDTQPRNPASGPTPDLPAAVNLPLSLGSTLPRLPWSLRILAENVLRHAGPAERKALNAALIGWCDTGTSTAEVDFHPDRVLMHDTTCGPALVDIAAMRDVVAEGGGDPAALTPLCPVHAVIDHSLGVDRFGTEDALAFNMTREIERNSERYRFMKWAGANLANFHVFPPGVGILHTINMETLAQVVASAQEGGRQALHAETLIGTDSHTPMINALGVLAWGVGGLEAESVMFGMPVSMRIPDVVGVHLTGRLEPGVLATDAALELTHRLRALGVVDCFVEFHGPGLSALTVGERAAIANMAPEYGATVGYFPIDARTLDYLLVTGRTPAHAARVEAFARAQGLWHDPDAEPRYTRTLEVDLSAISATLAGPTRPQDHLAPRAVAASMTPILARHGHAPLTVPQARPEAPRDGAVAIAAITSCTNTSDSKLLVAAGLLARKANRLGLKPPSFVKTSLAPGSGVAARYLERAGLLDDLEALGFGIVGFGCTTCIGNSGPLVPEMAQAVTDGVVPAAVISGNRNFPGRIHPQVEAAFLASPPLVIAYALAGHVALDILADPITTTADGAVVRLADLWPSEAEIAAALVEALRADDTLDYYGARKDAAAWAAIEAPRGPTFLWESSSTYLRRPPFVARRPAMAEADLEAAPLLVLGDDVTTDHISPAGAIPRTGLAGRHLTDAGEDPADLNVFAARRGNYQVMVRGLFTNPAARNLLTPDAPAGTALFAPTGEQMPVTEAAELYAQADIPVVIVAGERYGTGSSRDWAAKGASLLGVRAVIARSFERIHRANLVAMGVLPVILPETLPAAGLALSPGDRIAFHIDPEALVPRMPLELRILRADGRPTDIVTATVLISTAQEAAVLRAGGVIPFMLDRALTAGTPRHTGTHS